MNCKLINIISALFITLVSPLVVQLSASSLQYLSQDDWVQFHWSGDSIGGKYYEKLAIILPMKIGTIEDTFSAQFDLGANVSILYGKNLQSLFPKYPTIKNTFAEQESDLFKNIVISIGNHQFTKPKVYYQSDYGESINPESENFLERRIGTIGSELFNEKILIIDYPNARINIVDSLQLSADKHFHFVPIKIANHKPIISVDVNGDSLDFLFDTGSSIFPFLVRNDYISTFVDTTSKENLDSLEVSSWGEKHYVVGYMPKIEYMVGGYKLPNSHIYTFNLDSVNETLKQDEVVGVMGNYHFFDKIVIIDYKNQRFGISK